jgi:hypothetical protein
VSCSNFIRGKRQEKQQLAVPFDGSGGDPSVGGSGSVDSFCHPTPLYDIELDITKVPADYKGAFSNAVNRW